LELETFRYVPRHRLVVLVGRRRPLFTEDTVTFMAAAVLIMVHPFTVRAVTVGTEGEHRLHQAS